MDIDAGVSDAGSGSILAGVLDLFRRQGPLTRAEVVALTGLARSTVNQRVDALCSLGLLAPAGSSQSTGGRRPGRFAFAVNAGVILVADIGASHLRAAVCDLAGARLAERDLAIEVGWGPVRVLALVDQSFTALLAQVDRQPTHVHGVGLGVPGPVEFATGRVVSPPIMTGWDGFDIPAHFAERYACPIVVDNDVNVMAFGEQRTQHPQADHLLMLKLGTGVGCGIIAGGAILRGSQGSAGDIGHIHIRVPDVPEEPLCRCGNTGCVEAYTGGWALARDLRDAGRDVETVTDVVKLIRAGDAEAVRLARRAGRILGEAVAHTVSLLNPHVVVLGGQLIQAEEQILAGMRELVYSRSLPLATRSLNLVRSRLGPDAAVTGTALLAIDAAFSPARISAMTPVADTSPHTT